MKLDKDIKSMSFLQLRLELMRLRNRIRKHRDAKGNARCWLNDYELYELLPERKRAKPINIPECVFLKNCKRYFRRNKKPE